MTPKVIRKQRGEGTARVLISLALFFVAAISIVKIAPLHISGNGIKDQMEEESNFGRMKPDDKMQYAIWKKAVDEGAPISLQDVKISRQGSKIRIKLKYEKKVSVFGYQYVYKFDNEVEKEIF